MFLLTVLVASFIGLGICEKIWHRRNLARIKIRVHVNGSRGKSTVTRLIAAGLRAGGWRVVAKTTGTAPRLIYPDGSEKLIPRRGPPNIREQAMVVAEAARLGADALVVECMAVQPELQEISEREYIRATVGVITNVRPDHLDVMGPTLKDVAQNLARTIPAGKLVFTAEQDLLPTLQREAQIRKASVVAVQPDIVPAGFTRHFSYLMFSENLAVALAVCEHFGVPRQIAYEGMRGAQPDPGVLRAFRWRTQRAEWICVNAFAANDPVSTEQILSGLRRGPEPFVCLVNLRPDRPQRTLQYIELVAKVDADLVLVVGAQRHLFARLALWQGLNPERLLLPPQRTPAEVMAALGSGPGLLVGIGNIAGLGQALVEFWAREGEAIDGNHLWLGSTSELSPT